MQRIVAELEEAELSQRERVGRQNHYVIHAEGRLAASARGASFDWGSA